MNAISLVMRPRLLLSKLGERWGRRFDGRSVRRFFRDHLRKWCVDDELVVGTRAGFKMRVSPRDYISHRIFFFGDYDPSMTQALRFLVREGDVACDLGTERGWFTLHLARLVGPRGQVHAFEAFPPNVAKLQANVELNGMHWVRVNGVGISDAVRTMYFEPPSADATQNLAYLDYCGGVGYLTDAPGPRAITVPTTTLDEYVAEVGLERLDFVKIDIEGAEVAALEGGRNTLSRFRPLLIVEYNRDTMQRAGSSWERLDTLLDEFGYDRFVYNNRFRKLTLDDYATVPGDEAVFNVYCFPRVAKADRAVRGAAHALATGG